MSRVDSQVTTVTEGGILACKITSEMVLGERRCLLADERANEKERGTERGRSLNFFAPRARRPTDSNVQSARTGLQK